MLRNMNPSPLEAIFTSIELLDRAATHTDAARKSDGITYTPVSVVREMVALAAPNENEMIHEPSCGRGVFIFGLVEHWLAQGRSLAWVDAWAQAHLRCGDLDATAIEDLKTLWLQFFAEQGHAAAPIQAVVQDGLFGELAQTRADLILGNPPYVRVQHLPENTRAALRAKYAGCAKGNVDLYYAFFEDALHRAKRVCYIMPNSWLANASAKRLRQTVLPRLTHLVDFGSRLVFAPVRAYTAIVLCEAEEAVSPVISVRANLPGEGGEWTDLQRTDARWSLDRFHPLNALGDASVPMLGSVVEVVSGIATLADHAFALPSPERFERHGEPWVRQVDPLDSSQALEVPERYAPRLLKATKVSLSPEAEGARILCPYDAAWKIVDEATLEREAPDLLAWLGRRRTVLEGRDKGKTQGYEAWYAYGRRQGFWSPRKDEHVLLMPMMGNGRLASVPVDVAALGGRFLFTSGFVLRPLPEANLDLAALSVQLGSATAWAFVKREGKAWAGAGDYMTLGARALRRLPLVSDEKEHHADREKA